MVSSVEMSRNRLVNITVLYGTKVFSKSVRQTLARFADVKFTTFNARNAVNDVGGAACKIVLNEEIGFRSGNGCGRVEERTRVTTNTRARKGTRWCRQILCIKLSAQNGTAHWELRNRLSQKFLLRLKLEIRGLSVKMADVISKNLKITANDVPNFVVKGVKFKY